MKMLYVATSGSADATKASIPFHLAVNGSIEVGHDASILLAGDAAEIMLGSNPDDMEGIGIPPMRDLLAKVREHAVPVYV